MIPHLDCNWERLPIDIQKNIFCELSREVITPYTFNQLLVSKKISNIIYQVKRDWINDQEICLRTLGCKTAKEAIDYIIKHQLTSANLSAFSSLNDSDLTLLKKNFPLFKKLSLQSLYFSSDKLAHVLSKIISLQSLKLHLNLNNSEKLIEAIGKHTSIQNLHFLSISPGLGDNIAEILKNFIHLQKMNVSWWKTTADNITKMLENHTYLKGLNMASCFTYFGEARVHMINKLPYLEELNLGGLPISGDHVERIVNAHPMIQMLNLSYCSQIHGDDYVKMAEKLPNLRLLDISYCSQISNNHLIKMAEKLPFLQSLNIDGMEISDINLIEVIEMLPHLESLTHTRFYKNSYTTRNEIAIRYPMIKVLQH